MEVGYLYGILLLIGLRPPGGQGQITPAGGQSEKAWTFDMPGVSYIDSVPPLVTSQDIGWRFEFKTRQPNTLLFHHKINPYDRRKFPKLHDYELFWEIKHGSLHVLHHLNGWQDEITLGIALSDDRWHLVSVTVNGKTGQATVRLDNQMAEMRPYGLPKAARVLVWENLTTTASFGGTERPISMGMSETFIGCMQGLQYLTDKGDHQNVMVHGWTGVVEGCIDLCSGANPCQNAGQCVSQYTQTVCDCFGTGYEGSTCQIPGSTVVTLHGYDWIVYKLYDKHEDRVNRGKHRFGLEFKTQRGSGVLLYAMGSTPINSHVIATLYAGSVHIAVSFGVENLEINMGIGLDNESTDGWHNLTIHHMGSTVEVHLDGVVKRRSTKGDNPYLSLDPNIYFGGGHNFVRTRGLKVTQNFVGCLRNLYVDVVSVLYNINKGSNMTIYSGKKLTTGCESVDSPPLTFPRSGTMLLLDSGQAERLLVQFEFRTVRHEAVIFHTELMADDKEVGYDIGDLEVWISNGEILLHFKPSSRYSNYTQDISIGEKVNDAMWHSLQITFVNKQVWLRLDGKQVISQIYPRSLSHRGNIVIGHGLRMYRSGFVGCMRRLYVQGKTIDPLVMVQSKQAVGVVLDGCELIDRCKGLDLCEHESTCVSDWEGVFCDCSRVAYEGETCHFPKYLRTCDEYYQAGWRASGVYRIDPDSEGPLTPVYVECHMGYTMNQEGYGITIIHHNLPLNFTARELDEPSRKVQISYRGVDRFSLEALTYRSLGCRQHITYQCKGAKLSLGKLSWFKSASSGIVDYLGTGKRGECNCANNDTCLQSGTACNCDAGLDKWSEDRGFNTEKSDLPLTDMVFMQDNGQAVLTLGPLECWGNRDHEWSAAVTFKSSEAFVTAPAWREGDLEVNFKTTQTSATILHQTSQVTSVNFVTITILQDRKLEIVYNINGNERTVVLRTKTPFSNGQWNQVRIEHDDYNARFTLNDVSKMVNLKKGENFTGFDGLMYVGSPGPKLSGSQDGIIGCVRGLVYNKLHLNLAQFVKESDPDVEKGCTASCQSNPCHHGATCIEDWGKFRCECVNNWSHLGENCENNIDEIVATVDGSENAYLEVNVTNTRVMSGTIVFSFRTFQANALLFYMYDHFNNFLQLELRNARELFIQYNSLTYIRDEFIQVEDLNDGKWKQVIIDRLDGESIRLQCGKVGRNFRFRQNQDMLKTYLSQPFTSPESVQPVRPLTMDKSVEFVKLFVGGVPEEMKTTTTPNTLHGCVRGFRSNMYVFDLEEAAGKQNGTSVGCVSGCQKQGCQNGGHCEELWNGNYQCNCANSYFSGVTCQTDPSAVLDGMTVIQSGVSIRGSYQASSTYTEKVTLQFTANSTVINDRVVLAFVYSSTSNDYIIIYLTKVGDVVVETFLGAGTYLVKKSGNFLDDQKHTLEYKRKNTELSLSLDKLRPSTVVQPQYTLDGVDTIMVGGVISDSPLFADYHNFTGCITDVVYYPTGGGVLNFNPLKEYHAVPQPVSVKVWGKEPIPCNPTPPIMEKPQQEIPSTPSVAYSLPEVVTMPPWNVGPAEVELIRTTDPPASVNNTQVVPIITASSDYLTIIIAVTLVTFLLVVALIIALLLARLRRRHERYDVNKETGDYHELKQPLKLTPVVISHENRPSTNGTMPANHLATMDEFSLASGATLDRESPENHYQTRGYGFPDLSPEEAALLNPPLNRKTNRPASSISEVLEEMERRRKAKALGLDPDVVVLSDSPVSVKSIQMHGEGELEWDPQAHQTPLSCIMDYSDIYQAELPGDENFVTEVHLEPILGDSPSTPRRQKTPPGDMADVSHRSESPGVRGEFNGDSGYEAGSKPEVEDDHTPSPDTNKLYKCDVTEFNSESLIDGDGVRTRLINGEAETAC